MVIMKTLPSRGAQQQLFINAHHRLSERPQGTAGILMTKVAKSSKCIIHLILCIVVCPILDSREFILWWRNVECPWRRSNCGATLDYLERLNRWLSHPDNRAGWTLPDGTLHTYRANAMFLKTQRRTFSKRFLWKCSATLAAVTNV